MEHRTLGIAITILALAGGACDFAPRCPANTQYDGTIRRCVPIDAGTPGVDAFVPPAEDAGGDEDGGADEDAGASDDAATGDDAGATDDASIEDAGGDDAGGSGSGGGGMRDR